MKCFLFAAQSEQPTPAPPKTGIYAPKPIAQSEQPTPAPPKRGIYAPKPEANSQSITFQLTRGKRCGRIVPTGLPTTSQRQNPT